MKQFVNDLDQIELKQGRFQSFCDSMLNINDCYVIPYVINNPFVNENRKGFLYVHNTGCMSVAEDGKEYSYIYGEYLEEAESLKLIPLIEKSVHHTFSVLLEAIWLVQDVSRYDFEKSMEETEETA